MTKSIGISLLIFTLACITFFSCKKDVDKFIPDPDYEWSAEVDGDINNLLQLIQPKPDTLTAYNGEFPTQVISSRGTRVTFPPNAVRKMDGSEFQGNFTVRFTEAYTKSDMLSLQRPTVTDDGRLLESAGFFDVQLSSNGEPLQLVEPLSIDFITLGPANEEMEVFVGGFDSQDNFAWAQRDGEVFPLPVVDSLFLDSIFTEDPSLYARYLMVVEEVGWINCDAFANLPTDQLTQSCVQLPSGYTDQNAVVFTFFENLNSSMQNNGDSELKLFCSSKVPKDEPVKIVAVTTTGVDEFGLAHVETSITENIVVELDPAPATLEEILELLESL